MTYLFYLLVTKQSKSLNSLFWCHDGSDEHLFVQMLPTGGSAAEFCITASNPQTDQMDKKNFVLVSERHESGVDVL